MSQFSIKGYQLAHTSLDGCVSPAFPSNSSAAASFFLAAAKPAFNTSAGSVPRFPVSLRTISSQEAVPRTIQAGTRRRALEPCAPRPDRSDQARGPTPASGLA